MDDLGILHVIEVRVDQQTSRLKLALTPFHAIFSQRDVLGLLVLFVMLFADLLHDRVNRDVHVALVFGRTRDDQRGAGFVGQDRIDFVNDCVIERAVDHLAPLLLHVVAQVVKAQLVVGSVSDVAGISGPAFILRHVGHDYAHSQPQEIVDLAHPLGIAPGQIVVHGDDMHALAFKRIQIDRQRRHQGLALASAHFGDLPAVEDNTADHLHIEVAHAHAALAGLADRREGFRQDRVQRLAFFELAPELGRLRRQLIIGKGFNSWFERIDLPNNLVERLDITIVGRTEQGLGKRTDHGLFLEYQRYGGGAQHMARAELR